MGYKAIVTQISGLGDGFNQVFGQISVYSGTDYVTDTNFVFDFTGITNSADFRAALVVQILAYSVTNGYGMTEDDIIWGCTPKYVQAPSTRSIVTGTGATGFQVSTIDDAEVRYNLTIVTTASIAGGADGTIVLEMCATNSATAGDWIEVGRMRNGQALSLAITLQSVQTTASQLTAFVPRGYYVKIRSINNVGTPTYTYNSGQEVLNK